jgi:S-formylglutathione hydrolase FrmB
MNNLLDTSLVGGPFLVGLYVLTGAVVVVLVFRRLSIRRALVSLAGTAAAALFGWVLVWLVSDVWDVFGVSMSTPIRVWVAAFFAALVLAITNLSGSTWWRRTVAVVAIPLILLSTAAGINAEFGEFPTLRMALGIPLYGSIDLAQTAPAGSTSGVVGTVTIPASSSGFKARPAFVYLPAAALVDRPPILPVVEMLSGQPGSPSDVFTSGRLAKILDAYAAAHHGLAPIIVVPDQLGAPGKNPMCVDSPLGNAATYLTVDVPAWIRSHLTVASAPAGWAIAGFSEGGTCSIQLGAAHPELYGTIFDISGELKPKSGSPAHTIQTGFGGSAEAYAAAAPTAVLAAHAPYSALHIIFAVGADDARYLAWTHIIEAAARRAGATTDIIVSPGTAHDWHTVIYAWTHALPIIAASTGLPASR